MLGLGISAILLQASQVYIGSASVIIEQTITVVLMLLMVLAISMQIARSYFLRILRKFTLRLAADIWWLTYVLLKDASIFAIVFLGITFLWPGTYQDYPIAVPFQPISIVFFAIALLLMLLFDTDEDPSYNKIITYLVGIGSVLYIFGTIFITESAVQLSTLPPTVSNSTSNFWGYMYATFNSQTNPALAIYTFYAAFLIIVVAGGIAFASSLKDNAPRGSIKTPPSPIIKETQIPEQQKK
jgi:hypothetical protein